MQHGAAWATQRRWSSTQRKFMLFCGLSGVKDAVPTTPYLLMCYCAWLMRCGHDHNSIRQYVDGVRVLNCDMGHAHPWQEAAYAANRFKKGLSSLTDKHKKRGKKLPLRCKEVLLLVQGVRGDWMAMRFCCVLVCAYCTGSRIGHWCPVSNNDRPHLLTKDSVKLVMVSGKLAKACVTLPSTKTCSHPIEVWVFASKVRAMCPVAWLKWMMHSTSGEGCDPLIPHGPLGDASKKVWNRAAFNKELNVRLNKVGINPSSYSGVSLRKGCLTDLAIMGASPLAVSKQATHRSIQSQVSYVSADEAFMHSNATKLQDALANLDKCGTMSTNTGVVESEKLYMVSLANSQ